MSLVAWLAAHPERCSHGYHYTAQHFPDCAPVGEWGIFTAALTQAAKAGLVHQRDVRPLIRGRIEPKHIGTLYRRAKAEGLLREAGHEESDDLVGKNAGRLEPVYQLTHRPDALPGG